MRNRQKRLARTKAVIYCRVSTAEQVENLSLSTQEQRCIGYCSQKGWPIVRIFREEGESAKTTQRTEFQEMLKFCLDKNNGVGFVVFNDLSRFSRTSEDSILTRAQLFSEGIMIRSVTETIDETSTGNFMTNVFAAVHQLDNDRKAERTKTGMLAAAAAGRWPFKAPLGYQNAIGTRQGPNIVPDKNTSALVKKAFELFATGLHSKAEVLRVITSHGLQTAKGKPLSPQTFQKMIENPIYAGWVAIPKWGIVERGSFQPLVTQDLFDQVQDVLTGKKLTLTGYQKNRPDFPLRLFIQCAKCGSPLTGSLSSNGKNAKKYAYYRCRKNCEGVKATPDTLHSKFLELLQRLTPQPDSLDAIKDTIRTVWKQRQGDSEALRSVLRRKLSQAESRKATLVNRWLDGEVDKATYGEHVSRLSREIEEIRAQIRSTEFEHIELEGVLAFADRLILRPARLWVESSLDQRQRLQKTLFPEGIDFDGEEFGTHSTPLFFSLIEDDPNDSWGLASPTGFEPVLSP
jgi:site-specific DNA recombinase